jgi:hypothetical protein
MASPAHATAIAFSSISASALTVTAESGTIVYDPYTTMAFAAAQNSLGEADANIDSALSAASSAAAAVTWAFGSASSSEVLWTALSSVNIPGMTTGSATAQGQGLLSRTFTVVCGGDCGDDTTVDFSTMIAESLSVFTDGFGVSAQTQTIFNLLVDGETVLFWTSLLSIGSNDAQSHVDAFLLSGSQTFLYDTPYTLTLRVDSESLAVNVPEPATVMLLTLGGLAASFRARRARIKRR